MSEPNETPPGRLAEYLVGDLGPARRHIQRLLTHEISPSRAVLEEIGESLERCVRRIERDLAKKLSD